MRSVHRSTLMLAALVALMLVAGQLGRLAAPFQSAALPHTPHTVKLSVAEPPVRDMLLTGATLLGGLLVLACLALFSEATEEFAAIIVGQFHRAERTLLARPALRRYALRV